MPCLVRENLFIGNISDAAKVLQEGSESITHILSVLSSASISFFSEWRTGLSIPTQEIRKVYVGGAEGELDDGSKSSLGAEKLLYLLENAGKDLKLVRMGVPLRDMESENLLDYLDVCLDFIEESRKNGAVLVHCFAGVSRSAAIITAYLMRTERLSQEDCLYNDKIAPSLFPYLEMRHLFRDEPRRAVRHLLWDKGNAIESLQQSCESVCPNDGFLDQLKMFEEMGFKVDHASPIYKRFRLKVLGDSYNRGERIDSSKFRADPGLAKQEVSSEAGVSKSEAVIPTPAYRCKKCRRVVALKENVVDHVPGEGESSFDWHKRKYRNNFNNSDELECSSIFVEPLRWMTSVEEGALEGKLSCTHCEGRLGYFNWSGIQCSCGSWITPAFQLHKSRVDISTV